MSLTVALTTRVLQVIETPYVAGHTQLRISASVGAAQRPAAGASAAELIRMADAAMYEAKRAVKTRVHFAPH